MRILQLSFVLRLTVVVVLSIITVQCIQTDDGENERPHDQYSCPASCLLNKEEGSQCQPSVGRQRWYFNKDEGVCESFHYGGCHGNFNRFVSRKKCLKKCINCRHLLTSPQSNSSFDPRCECKEIDYTCRVSERAPQGYNCRCAHDPQQHWKCSGKPVPQHFSIPRDVPEYHTFKSSELSEMIRKRSNENILTYQKLIAEGRSRGFSLEKVKQNRADVWTEVKLSCEVSHPYRTINGTCNNIQNPLWGSTLRAFSRLLSPGYEDGFDEPRGGKKNSVLPNTRLISTTIHSDLILPDKKLTNMVTQLGQFLDHDLDLTPDPGLACCSGVVDIDCFTIKVFQNDTFYSRLTPPQTCVSTTRSTPLFPSETGIREQINNLNSFVDCNQIYGSDSKQEFQLREYSKGRLRVNRDNSNMLPTVKEIEEITGEDINFIGDYFAGDVRVNQVPDLTTMHTLMLREHNRMANEIYKVRSSWSDEIIFQETRRLMIAQWQKIIYTDYLPVVLGKTAMTQYKISLPSNPFTHTNYDPNVDPTVTNSFATAAFRYGHSMVNGHVRLVQGVKEVASYHVRDNYFNSNQINKQTPYGSGYDLILGGLIIQNPQTFDRHVTEDMTNFLQVNVTSNTNFGADLIATNIQRGRDHGLKSYGEYRQFCKLSPLTSSWSNMPKEMNFTVWTKLSSLYKSPLDIDLYTGGLTEIPVQDGILGPTFTCILSTQFAASKDGDRFFFTHSQQPRPFNSEQLTALRTRSLGDVICDNSQIQATPKNVFFNYNNDGPNPMISCADPSRTKLNMENMVPPKGMKFVHLASNHCLDVDQASVSDGSRVTLSPCRTPLLGNQRWDTILVDRNQRNVRPAKRIVAHHSGKCLGVKGQYDDIHEYPCNENDSNQEWTVLGEDDINNGFRVKNSRYGKCLLVVDDVGGGSPRIVLEDCNNGPKTHKLFTSFPSV